MEAVPYWGSTIIRRHRKKFSRHGDLAIGTFKPLLYKKVKWSRYKPGVAWRVGRGIALLFHDRGTRRRWVVSSTSRPHFTPREDPVPILQEAVWAPGPVWAGRKSRPHRDSIPDRPARSQSLYRLSYRAHTPALQTSVNPLNAELNPICHLLALLGAHHIFHVSGLRVNILSRLLPVINMIWDT